MERIMRRSCQYFTCWDYLLAFMLEKQIKKFRSAIFSTEIEFLSWNIPNRRLLATKGTITQSLDISDTV